MTGFERVDKIKSMRIIGGEYRSRLISMPKGVDIRPTQDKVRGAIFNILGDVSGKNVLELFAGSGAFGIEAISRWARHVTFVDNNHACVNTIRSNLEALAADKSKYDIVKADALKALPRLENAQDRFDMVFLDPPYYKDIAKNCLIDIDTYDILAPISLVVVEHFKKDRLDLTLKKLVLHKERSYGDTIISIFKSI